MIEKSLAAVAVDKNKTALMEIQIPTLSDNDGILRVEIVGVCGTDVSYYNHELEPKILGHHVVGYIEEIGELASKNWGVKKGDRVVMEEYIPCGQCEHCRTGEYRACLATDPKYRGIRYGATPLSENPSLYGGFSQYMYLHPNAVFHKMPEHVPAEEAAITLPLANGFEWMCIEGGAGPGKVVLIQGPGQQGLACALAAKYVGAEVIVTGRRTSAHRLELAKELGIDHTINIQTEDMYQTVDAITGGKMVDIVLDVTSGGTEPIRQAISVANKNAKIILGAYKYQVLSGLEIDEVIHKTLTIKGVRGHSYKSVSMARDCIASNKFPLCLLNSHNYPLDQTDQALKTAGGVGEPKPLLVTVSPWL
ncbi:alcohol dehydrogenase [Bacillus canaveralius]|uniref:Alcohol dehydrogenase n=1 Tax=Bacillus canaveralius TaxID=1403243 RepID=A0A2N5GMW0_9BACI|nr:MULTISPECIES: zinc-binding dehydrogenase [Bacillus]PLR82264.1 alcohol dehydrogenase [Bacillus sp. V33-4]PLR83459.1 alcohol dehydrogenase [Bacillus canaveralius]PLR95360.1 alcohol dehydrogenase [Bacillus canaveralius]RSK57082.1 alcohol dehydrogenase [Bacillus canaveralius]